MKDTLKNETIVSRKNKRKLIKKGTFLKILLPAIFTIFGVFLGNYLTYKNSYSLFTKQKIFDNQIIAFSKIMALKNPWTQSITSHAEANLFYEYYKTRYKLFSHHQADWTEAKKQLDKAADLINKVSDYQMHVFETLGLIQTCYKTDSELKSAINDIYNYKTITVYTFPEKFSTEKELDEILEKQKVLIIQLVDEEYNRKLDKLIGILKTKLPEYE